MMSNSNFRLNTFIFILLLFVTIIFSSAHKSNKIELKKIVTKYLKSNEVIEYKILQGSFGPSSKAIIYFYKEKECINCHFWGKVLIPKKGKYKVVALPDFHQFDNQTVDNIKIASVFFDQADNDKENEVFILVEGYKKGPGGWPLFVVAVLDWQKNKFVPIKKLENYFGENCSSTKCVKESMRNLHNLVGSYSSTDSNISADLEIKLKDSGVISGKWSAVYGAAHTCEVSFQVIPTAETAANFLKGTTEFADIVVSKNKAVVNFNVDMYKLDCGTGHPSKVNLKK